MLFLMENMSNTIGVIEHWFAHTSDWEYVSRKGRRSINTHLVGDAVVKWPGSFHAALYRELQNSRPDGIILGDHANPLLPWLTMTQLLTANAPEQTCFNTAHSKTRCTTGRINGVLKRRFACRNMTTCEWNHREHCLIVLTGCAIKDAIVNNFWLVDLWWLIVINMLWQMTVKIKYFSLLLTSVFWDYL